VRSGGRCLPVRAERHGERVYGLRRSATAVGQLRSVRFAHGDACRASASLSALAALRRGELPIARMARRREPDAQLDWTREFAHTDQRALAELGLGRPWYWPKFIEALEIYHHMFCASVYSYRKTVWFSPVLSSPAARAWLRSKYPPTWDQVDPIWECIAER
jgi:hypothetical protein